jgi:carotenoid cleavage dioxygenase
MAQPIAGGGSNTAGMPRRTALTLLGLGAAGAGMGLVGCGDGSSDGSAGGAAAAGAGGAAGAAGAGASTTTRVIPTYDPNRPYWVQGNFAPVSTEETFTELKVVGELPAELNGLFVRNGSNSAAGEPMHWFLGDGMVHGVRLEDGQARWYRNRYVQTPLQQSGKGLMEFGGVPGKENNQSNVSVISHGNKLLSLGEVGWPFELSTTDLSTVGAYGYDGRLGDTMTAHPKIDPDTGRLHFFGYEFLRPALTYYAADPSGQLDVVSPVPVDEVTMIHDFAITDRDVVFWIGPVMFGADATNPNPAVPFHWDPNGPCRVGIMPLNGSGDQIRWVDIPPCFVFHGFNAHREGDDVVVRVHQAAEAFGPGGDLVPSRLTEWRINTAGSSLTFASQQLHDRPMDLPALDRRLAGRAANHGWFATTTPPEAEYGFELAGIFHLDLDSGREDVWEPGDDLRGGEAYYVPASEDADEGEGWVMSYVWNRRSDLSSLAVFDAMAVAAGPVAEVQLPVRVPFGFHGTWVPDA